MLAAGCGVREKQSTRGRGSNKDDGKAASRLRRGDA